MSDLKVLKKTLPRKLEALPEPDVAPAAWEKMWKRFPGPRKSLVAPYARREAT